MAGPLDLHEMADRIACWIEVDPDRREVLFTKDRPAIETDLRWNVTLREGRTVEVIGVDDDSPAAALDAALREWEGAYA